MKSIAKQLSKINLRKVELTTGETVEQMMARMAQTLYKNIQYYIDKWYNEYHPKIYDRIGNYQKALYAEDIADIRVVGDTLVIGLGFYENLSWQKSLFEFEYTDDYGQHWIVPSRDVHESYVPVLMEYGWWAKKLEGRFHKRIKYFTYFEGISAVQKGVQDFYKEFPFMRNRVKHKLYLHDYKKWNI